MVFKKLWRDLKLSDLLFSSTGNIFEGIPGEWLVVLDTAVSISPGGSYLHVVHELSSISTPIVQMKNLEHTFLPKSSDSRVEG